MKTPAERSADLKLARNIVQRVEALHRPGSRRRNSVEYRLAKALLESPEVDAQDAARYRYLRDLPKIAIEMGSKASIWEKAYGTGTWSDWTWALKQKEALDVALDTYLPPQRGNT